MRRIWGLVLLFAAAAPAPAGDPSPRAAAGESGNIARTADFRRRVDTAITRGVEWLRKAQAANGSFAEYPSFPGGVTSLAYHTMRVCGVPKSDPAAVRAWTSLRRDYSPARLQTYSAALYLLAISEHGDRVAAPAGDRDVRLDADDTRFAAEIARVLAAGQDKRGRWSYGVSAGGPDAPGFDPGALASGEVADNSNTQYALLGLKAAARCGVAIDPAVWRRSLDHFLSTQAQDGREVPRKDLRPEAARRRGATYAPVTDRARGWEYLTAGGGRGLDARGSPGSLATPSMTAGGVSSVVICRSELLGAAAMTQKLAADSERAAWDGLAWLGSRWVPDPLAGIDVGAPERPEPHLGLLGNGLDYYAFYGVERAGVLAGVDWMAELDWYGDGAEALLRRQSNDGGWPAGVASGLVVGGDDAAEVVRRSDSARRIADVCFALLFLKRGTSPVARGAVTQAPDASDIRFDLADGLPAREFEDLLDLVLSRWIRLTDDRARAALFDGAVSMGPRIVPPLLVRLDSGDSSVRGAADALLRRATAQSFGFDAAADRPARDDAAMRWQSWWLGVKDRLRYDPDRGLLVVPAAR